MVTRTSSLMDALDGPEPEPALSDSPEPAEGEGPAAEGRCLSGLARRAGPDSWARNLQVSRMVAVQLLEESPAILPGRTARRDALPEHTRYADTGCDLQPSCLSCPLVRCRYDEPGGMRKLTMRDRDTSILRTYRAQGLTVETVARRFGLSRRTVFRVLARARDEEAARW